MGVPEDITLYLKDLYNINTFFETGTFNGWTSFWASKYFREVKTIEFSRKIYDETIERHKKLKNVDFIFGDSRSELKKIVKEQSERAIFWLDAHWCCSNSYGENDQCPLLEELDIINLSTHNNIILVDDARLFLSPPSFPNSTKFYPTISEIILKLNKKYYIIIYEDVIICIPGERKVDFISFMQKKITSDSAEFYRQKIKREKLNNIKRNIKKIIGYKFRRKNV